MPNNPTAMHTKALSERLASATRWGQGYRQPRQLASAPTPETPTRPEGASIHRLDLAKRARR